MEASTADNDYGVDKRHQARALRHIADVGVTKTHHTWFLSLRSADVEASEALVHGNVSGYFALKSHLCLIG